MKIILRRNLFKPEPRPATIKTMAEVEQLLKVGARSFTAGRSEETTYDGCYWYLQSYISRWPLSQVASVYGITMGDRRSALPVNSPVEPPMGFRLTNGQRYLPWRANGDYRCDDGSPNYVEWRLTPDNILVPYNIKDGTTWQGSVYAVTL